MADYPRHPHPLISDEDAEAILTQLQSGQGRRSRATDRVYLLSGILVDPAGQPYSGESYQGAAFYRLGKGAKVAATAVESTVLRLVLGEMCRPETAAAIAQRLRDSAPAKPKARDQAALRARLAVIDRKLDALVGLIADDPETAPAYKRSLVTLEAERSAVQAEIQEQAAVRETAPQFSRCFHAENNPLTAEYRCNTLVFNKRDTPATRASGIRGRRVP